MKSKLKKVLSILLCVGVLLPQGAMLAFAEAEITPKQEAAPKQEVVTEKEVETDAVITVKAKGNGNIIAKLASESDKSLKNAENSDTKLNANIGDEVFIKTYAVDGNTTSFSEEGLDLVSEDKQVLSINRIYKVTENKASLTASFTGGDAEGSSRQTPKMRAAAMRAASSMSTTITKVKSQYGYDANGNGSSWYNKYTKFNATGTYNNAAYCAEHSRDLSTSNVTGSVVSDSVIRKILYYGYRGPKQWSGFANSSYNGVYQLWGSENTDRTEICGTVVTAQAISDRWKAAGSGTGINCNPSGLSAFMAYVNSMPDPGSSWTVYIAKASGQDMAWGVYVPNGKVNLKKGTKNNQAIVNECPEMYSLEGAIYSVYKTKSDAENKVNAIGKLTTKNDGATNTLELREGTYYVRETTAPNGYKIDNTVYSVAITAGQTSTLNVKDEPIFDPIAIVLEKTATDGSYVNVNANMAGAEFTIKYYDSLKDDELNENTLKRTWKLQTKKHKTGKYVALLNDDWLLEDSDPLYKLDSGIPVLPRGTLTIQETKAPIGYNVDKKVYKYTVDRTSQDEMNFNFGNTPEQPNEPLNPSIGTKALDISTGDNVGSQGKKIILKDKVGFEEIQKDKTYTLKSVMMDQETGQVFTIDGKEMRKEKTFTVVAKDYDGSLPSGNIVRADVDCNAASGEVDIVYELDKENLEGRSVVFFEELYHNGELIASHKDISDENQTVHFAKIGTKAHSEITDNNLGMPSKDEVIIDEVDCKNLIVGKEYTIKGKLMNKKTGEPLLIDEKEVTAEKTFTATEKDMVIKLSFKYDASKMQGETIVVFEDMYHNGILVESHADLEDEGQTITYPNMGTTAWIESAGKRVETVEILDRVEYKDLKNGFEYTVKGILMDKHTGEVFKTKDGKEVTSELTFIPEEKDGYVDLSYKLNLEDIANTSVVVFEQMYYKDELIMSHEDIDDKNQTVGVGHLDVWYDGGNDGRAGIVNTGDDSDLWLFMIILVGSAITLAIMTNKRKEDEK